MSALLAFTLAGLLGGLAVGFFDAPTAASAGIAAAFGVLGLDALLGAALGLAAGLLRPLIPPPLRALSLLRRTLARLRPGAHDALQDRCRTVTGVWILALALPALLFALHLTEPLLLGRIRSRFLAALAVALLGLALTGLALALIAPLLAGLARGLETLVRRRPALTPLTRPDSNLALAALTGGLLAWALLPPTDLTPLLALSLLVGLTLLGGDLLHGRRRALLLLPPGLIGAALAAWFGLAAPAARATLADTPALGLLLRTTRAPASPAEPGP